MAGPGYDAADLRSLFLVKLATLADVGEMKAGAKLAVALAAHILRTTPKCPDQTTAINRLREVMMYADGCRLSRETDQEDEIEMITRLADLMQRITESRGGSMKIDEREKGDLLNFIGAQLPEDDEPDELDQAIADLSSRHDRSDLAQVLRDRFSNA